MIVEPRDSPHFLKIAPVQSEDYGLGVPRKIRDLLKDLRTAGFVQIPGAGKGSHRKFVHPRFPGSVTVSGDEGDDTKSYQDKQIRKAIEEVQS